MVTTATDDPVAAARAELAATEAERAEAEAQRLQSLADSAAARARRVRESVTGSAPGR